MSSIAAGNVEGPVPRLRDSNFLEANQGMAATPFKRYMWRRLLDVRMPLNAVESVSIKNRMGKLGLL